jgi:hypothetical protein
MNKHTTSILLTIALFFYGFEGYAQTSFPSVTWNNAVNLSSVLPAKSYELSGLYWNDSKKQLFIVCDDGKLIVLHLETNNQTFWLLTAISNLGGPEGITQVDNTTNEFHTIDENNYQIRKYALSTDYSKATLKNSWNLLSLPSPMTDTGNTGPEGIAFVPDWFLKRIGFVSAVTGAVYQSTKGMNGLLFIAHQNGGYVWVFDVNPAVDNDFIFVGKYKTSESESCDLAFDNSTGYMYILHNTGSNYLEVTDLTTSIVKGEYKWNDAAEYFVPNPSSGSTNVEGFALSPKFSDNNQVSAWFCRDVSSSSESADCLRWFYPFNSIGENITASAVKNITYKPNFEITTDQMKLKIRNRDNRNDYFDIGIYDDNGKIIFEKKDVLFPFEINLNFVGLKVVCISKNDQIIYSQKVISNYF